MTPLSRARQTLTEAGYILEEDDEPGTLRIVRTQPSGNLRSIGRLWQRGDRIEGKCQRQGALIAEALGDAGISLGGHLATLYGRRQLPTLGFVRQQPDGRWWCSTGLGDRTVERGRDLPSLGEACEVLEAAEAVAIVPLRDGETGWDGAERLMDHLREANLDRILKLR